MKQQVERMLNAKPMLPGTLEEHYNVCGKAQCRCKDKINPRKHGPYYRLSYSLKGKNSSVFVKKEDAPAIREMTENYRESRSNTQDLALEMIELYRHEGLQSMLDKYEVILGSEISKRPELNQLQGFCVRLVQALTSGKLKRWNGSLK